MLSLIKIRATYLKRKKGTVIFSYLLIPTIISVAVIYYMMKKDPSEELIINEKQEFSYDKSLYLFSNSNYDELKQYLSNSSLVVNHGEVGKKLVNYIKDKTNISLTLYSDEDQLNNYSQNIIILDYNEKKKTYKFSYKEREIVDFFYQKTFPFNTTYLSSQNASDVFKYDYKNYQISESQNFIFFKYQSFFAKFLIELENKSINKDIHFNLGLNSYPPSVKDPQNYDNLEPILSYLMTMQFSFIFLSFSVQMLEEKDQKLEKLLERQGIGRIKYVLSWLINYLFVGIVADFACIVGSTQILKSFTGLFIIDLILFNLAQFSLLLFIVTLSNNKKSGIILVNLLCFGSLVLGYVLTQGESHKFIQTLFNLFPNANTFSSIKCIIKLQNIGIYSWDNLRLSYNKISYLDTLIMFIIEIIFYIFISFFAKYYQNSGLPFLDFLKSIFTKVSRDTLSLSNNVTESSLEINHEDLNEVNQSLKSNNTYLNLKNVTRKYDQLLAVDNFSGELFKNEIFCLLGHNGAGKTTLIKMISGTEDPDRGDIFLNGISVITDKNYLYHNIGLCQQEDIFFEYLTVSEHLKYMMEIKGVKSDKEQIEDLINKIDLKQKKDAICKNLSGGEKRKLCIAMALIGNSQLVLLDEPTSGMDVMAKRALWDFLKEFKKDKIIILTTHSLDEAEYLGDRIGIMSNGHFICSGTSSYLKTKYPCGFNLNLLVNSKVFNENYKQQLYNQLIKYEPNLEVKIASKGLFSINIQSNNQNIKEIFDVIEANKAEFGIEDYTVSSTSLEDVFLKLNQKIEINEKSNELTDFNINQENFEINTSSSFLSQLKSHTNRGFFSIWRNKGYSFLELMIGLFTLYIYVIIYSSVLGKESQNTLSLTDLLENNDIFICENSKEFLKESYVYDDLCSISLESVGNQDTKNKFIDGIYENSLGHIGKSGICVSNINEIGNTYEVFNTEIPMSIPGYIMANTMFTVSAFLKKEYGIKAAIFDEIINIRANDIGISVSQISIMFSLCFGCSISLCIYLATIIAEKIRERTKNIKHILYLSGANMCSYWCGFYIVDIVKMIIFSSLAAASIYIISSYASYIWIDLIITLFSSLIFVYSISFLFEKEESGQKALSFLIFLILIIFVIVVLIMVSLGVSIDLSFILNKYNFTIFDISPITSFMLSSLRLTFSFIIFKSMNNLPIVVDEFNFDPLGTLYRPKVYILTSLMVHSINLVFYSCLLVLLESGYLRALFNYIKVKFLINESNITFSNEQMSDEFMSSNNIDTKNINDNEKASPLLRSSEDGNYSNNVIGSNPNNNCIQKEINKINSDTENRLTTKIIGLKKTYWFCCRKNIRAVNNLYLGLENNEKFGLLGFNGSGKTTTFKSITREILYDSGSIILFGKNNKTQFQQIRQSIGYCPQENPLFDYMKVKEIIKFYLELKGVNESVENICEKFGLQNYLNTYCINLSGGNKRKLSFAIALMCRPKVVLLDEPSTGVDPESRRIMWKNIMELSKKNKNLNMILSTHSMEEAEVLCDIVSWLKSGNFLSIGNPEKLKIALSAGYKLHIKFVQLSNNLKLDVINDSDVDEGFLENMSSNINGFNNHLQFVKTHPDIQDYLKELVKVIDLIRDKCYELILQKINKDYSFEFNIQVIKEKQSELFTQVLDMKNVNKLLSEISISMESLENILTKL